MNDELKLELWEAADERDRADRLWRMQSYRLALQALDLGWNDVQTLDRMRITRHVAPQLYDALGSIGANVAEGYSRSSGLASSNTGSVQRANQRSGTAQHVPS